MDVGERSSTGARRVTVSRGRLIGGWALGVLPSLLLLTGAVNAFARTQQVVEGTGHLGYPVHLLPVIGALELVCAVTYLVPQTAVLGAILLTGYFGGAVASHLRIGEATWPVAVAMGIIVWAGLWLREPRLAALLPVRRGDRSS